eukprot:6192756-Pleurochrysis_carterae.AAC.3
MSTRIFKAIMEYWDEEEVRDVCDFRPTTGSRAAPLKLGAKLIAALSPQAHEAADEDWERDCKGNDALSKTLTCPNPQNESARALLAQQARTHATAKAVLLLYIACVGDADTRAVVGRSGTVLRRDFRAM